MSENSDFATGVMGRRRITQDQIPRSSHLGERSVGDLARVNQEFDPIKVDQAVANDSADAGGFTTIGVHEFNIDLSSYG
jgi:hypothetical protein